MDDADDMTKAATKPDMTYILDTPMAANDSHKNTVRGYLKALLSKLWNEGESFSGKRPFGNSGWEHDLYLALVTAGHVKGAIDEDGYLQELSRKEEQKANRLIHDAIWSLT